MGSGAINTDMFGGKFNSAMGEFELSKEMIPAVLKSDIAEAWEIAASIAFLLGDESRYVTKAVWNHDGGWMESTYSS
jgi:NAD(P)-dependent dehydrogenase (short-subunit alcohol dehydrogenase family)